MANSLIAASKNLDKADFEFNPGQEIAKQVGLGFDAFEKKQASDKAEAHDVLENLNKDLVGFDYMNEQAQEYYEKSLGDISPQLAEAKRTKNAKEVRRLETLASNLIKDQNLIGELLKAHAEDTLSENYSEGANTHLLDMLATGKYRIKEIDGERRIVFGKSNQMQDEDYENSLGGDFITYDEFTRDFTRSNNDKNQIITKQDIIDNDLREDLLGKNRYEHTRRESYMGGKNGIPLNKLADYAIVNDPNVTAPYMEVLKDIKKDAANGLDFENSPNKNKLEAILNKIVPNVKYVDEENAHVSRPEDDQIVNLLYSRDFNLKNGKNLAELWVEEHKDIIAKEFKNKLDTGDIQDMRFLTYFAGKNLEASDLKPGTAIYDMVVSNGFQFSKGDDFKNWVKSKLTTGASNYHAYNFKKKGGDDGNITQAAASLFGTKSIPMPGFPGVYLDPQTRYNRRLSVLNENSNSPITLQSGTWSYNEDTKKWNDGSEEQLSTYQLLDREALRVPSDQEADGSDPFAISSDMLLGTEKEIVNRFSNNQKLKNAGFTFDTEFDLGSRAMNIYYGGKGVMIDLDDSNAVEKIMKFFNNKKPNLN